jgi:hypothetical protein
LRDAFVNMFIGLGTYRPEFKFSPWILKDREERHRQPRQARAPLQAQAARHRGDGSHARSSLGAADGGSGEPAGHPHPLRPDAAAREHTR